MTESGNYTTDINNIQYFPCKPFRLEIPLGMEVITLVYRYPNHNKKGKY